MISAYLEPYTYEYLLNLALSKVPDTLDKRQGSIIYDALAPACYVLAEFNMRLIQLLDNTFIGTSKAEFLDLKVAEQGITRYTATLATRRGVFSNEAGEPFAVPLGSRFSTVNGAESVNFTVESVYIENGQVVPGSYNLICEEPGTVGNNYSGDLLPLTNIEGLAVASLTTIVTPARDEETDDELRARYVQKVNEKAFGGNVAQYDEMIRAISGVGEVQIYPVWNGGGTVKCSIIDAEYNSISTEFISQIQEAVDPTPQGQGLGMAPIGHKVTITTPTEVTINVETDITISNTHSLESIRQNITTAINNYLTELRQAWGVADDLNEYKLSVYIAKINSAMLMVDGVANVVNTRINGSTADRVLVQNATLQEIPVIGTVTLNE